MARPSLVPGALGRGSSLTELQLDANQSSSTKVQHNYYIIVVLDITIQISMLRRCVICLKSKLLRQTKEINQH